MIAAFFHDERFTLDREGRYYSCGTLPYRAFGRYLRHFDRIVVVGRVVKGAGPTRTLSSGDGIEWACVDPAGRRFPAYVAAVASRAREVMRRVDCAVVRLPGVVGAIAAREALRAGKPYLAEVVGDVLEALWTNGNPKGKLAALPMYVVNRRYITGAPFATYVTRTTLQRRYPPSGEWVNASNVIVDAPRPEVLARRLARIEASDPAAPPLLGLVGSYDVDYKGHETALRAMAVLQRDGFAVRLRCIGVGDPSRWRARARALGVNDSVELDGPLPHGAAVMAWMDALDLCIAPSLTEGLPRAVVEAMSRALPAIGARAGGIPELLEDRMLHAPKDHRALARLVRGLATGRAEMQRQARRNWEAAAEYAAGVIERRRDALFARFRAAAEEAARARGSKGAGCRPDRLAQSDARGS